MLVLACAFSVLTVSAQRASSSSSSFFSTEKSDEGVVFGIRGGILGANMSFSEDGSSYSPGSRIGFNAGVNVDIPLMQSLHLQTGLFLQQKGFKMEEDGETWKVNPMYLQIPVLASYRYAFSDACELQINVGPYLAYGISGKSKYEVGGDEAEYDFFGGEDDDDSECAKSFDMGLSFGAGVTVAKHYYLGFSYDLGLTNIGRDDDGSIKNKAWMINLGYNF